MAFLATLLLLLCANLLSAHRSMRGEHAKPWIGILHMFAVMVGMFAFAFALETLPFQRDGISPNDFNWAPAGFLVFSAVSAVLFGSRLYRTVQGGFDLGCADVRFGVSLLVVIGAVYMGGSVVDHFVFFRDAAQSGEADVRLTGTSMTCSGGVVLTRITDSTAEYRCPSTVRLARDYSQPFVPWPAYTAGESDTLKSNIELGAKVATGAVQVPADAIKIIPSTR